MTDGEILGTVVGSVVAGGGGFVAFLKWAVGQWREERKLEREAAALIRSDERQDRRDDRAAINNVALGVDDVQLTLAAMLERDRVRSERRKRDTGVPEHVDDGQNTDVVEIKQQIREARAAARAVTPLAVHVRPRTSPG